MESNIRLFVNAYNRAFRSAASIGWMILLEPLQRNHMTDESRAVCWETPIKVFGLDLVLLQGAEFTSRL